MVVAVDRDSRFSTVVCAPVHTRTEGEVLVVTRTGMTMRFPLALVDRIEEAEVVEIAPRADPAGVEENAPDSAPEPAEAETSDATAPSSRAERRRVFLRNEVDQISFELDRSRTVTQRRVSGDTDADEDDWFSMMDPANLLSDEAGEIRYDLVIGLRTVHPNVPRSPEEHARNWLRRARLAFLDGPMETRRRGEVRTRTVGERDYSVFRYWHEWSGSICRSSTRSSTLFGYNDCDEQLTPCPRVMWMVAAAAPPAVPAGAPPRGGREARLRARRGSPTRSRRHGRARGWC